MNKDTINFSKKTRDNNLDLLRIMACIAVVGLHTLHKDLSLINSSLYYLCGFAVPVFFMASGYTLLNRETVKFSYSIRKINSIIKLILIWDLIFGVVEIFFSYVNHNFNWFLVIDIIIDIPRGFWQSGKFFHFWYFGALILIYFILPILHRFCKQEKHAWLIWILLVVVCITIQVLSYITRQPVQKNIRQMFHIWTWFQYFILGGIISRNREMILTKIKHLGILMVFVSAVVVVEQNVLGRLVLRNLYAEYFYDDIITMIWCSLIFLWGIRRNLSEGMINKIQNIAPLTLGVYIIHPFLIRYIGRYFTIDTLLLSLLYFTGVLVVSFGLTYIIKRIKLLALIDLR